MSKIIVSSDYHLRFSSQFDKTTNNGISSRLEEIITSINWVSEIGLQKQCNTFISCGDAFDSAEKLLTKEGIIISNMLKEISATYSNTIFISGNHEKLSADHSILDLFNPIIKVVSTPSFIDILGARLFFLPYIRESEDFYSAIQEFKKFDVIGKKYLFAHFWDFSVMEVDTEAIDLTKADLSMFDRVFTGHFHVPSSDINSKVIYVGTLLNKKFNETGPKGCWLLDTDLNTVEFIINPHSPEFFNTTDQNILNNSEFLDKNAYYKVACDPENVLEISKLLSHTKGFELTSKQLHDSSTEKISLLAAEKKNTTSFKEYVLLNCKPFIPEGVSEADFKKYGETFLSGL